MCTRIYIIQITFNTNHCQEYEKSHDSVPKTSINFNFVKLKKGMYENFFKGKTKAKYTPGNLILKFERFPFDIMLNISQFFTCN